MNYVESQKEFCRFVAGHYVVMTRAWKSGEVVVATDIAASGCKLIKRELVFAGFWRDGAVVEPDAKHWSDCKCIFAIQKHDRSLDICLRNFDEWSTVYWLDTTTPTELTPQEAFELLRVVYPQLDRIHDDGDGFAMMEGSPLNSCIKWDGKTQYPPRNRWRVPTDADKGSVCRVKDSENESWYESRFLVTDGKRFIARRDEDSYAYPYDFCEVLDESN